MILLQVLFFVTSAWADGGGGLFELAKSHQMIFKECFSRAPYEPGLTDKDFADVPAEDREFIYILEHNLKKLEADVTFAGHPQHILCREWIPYLSQVYFYDGRGQASLIRNLHARFRQEKGLE